jgi:carboxyl-terminal processing protease
VQIASNRGTGMNFGFPDTCRTPVGPAIVPIPYPNCAPNAMAEPVSPNVLYSMLPAINMASINQMSFGDEPGVAHYSIKGLSTFTAGNPKVFLNGMPAINLTNMATGNELNEGASMQAIPSATNVFLTYRVAGLESRARCDDGPLPEPAEPAIWEGRTRGARPGVGSPRRASLEDLRAVVASLPLDGSSLSHAFLAPHTGYLRIRRFSADVPPRLFSALRALAAAGAGALVIDLRGNPGGELSAALAAASEFVAPGTPLVTARDADGDDTVHRSRGEEPCSWPLVLVVDGQTASAAEVFAGSLQAHGRARVVGQRTVGKGVGLSFGRAADGALAAATAVLFLPGGAELHGHGVAPDIELPLSEDAVAHAAELLQ